MGSAPAPPQPFLRRRPIGSAPGGTAPQPSPGEGPWGSAPGRAPQPSPGEGPKASVRMKLAKTETEKIGQRSRQSAPGPRPVRDFERS
jgi:hypothetical protein